MECQNERYRQADRHPRGSDADTNRPRCSGSRARWDSHSARSLLTPIILASSTGAKDRLASRILAGTRHARESAAGLGTQQKEAMTEQKEAMTAQKEAMTEQKEAAADLSAFSSPADPWFRFAAAAGVCFLPESRRRDCRLGAGDQARRGSLALFPGRPLGGVAGAGSDARPGCCASSVEDSGCDGERLLRRGRAQHGQL